MLLWVVMINSNELEMNSDSWHAQLYTVKTLHNSIIDNYHAINCVFQTSQIFIIFKRYANRFHLQKNFQLIKKYFPLFIFIRQEFQNYLSGRTYSRKTTNGIYWSVNVIKFWLFKNTTILVEWSMYICMCRVCRVNIYVSTE